MDRAVLGLHVLRDGQSSLGVHVLRDGQSILGATCFEGWTEQS